MKIHDIFSLTQFFLPPENTNCCCEWNRISVVSGKNCDDLHVMYVLAVSNPKKNLEGDTSVMTYRGHSVLQTLVRCHFSPEFTTGQRYIYTGCAAGRVVSKYVSVIWLYWHVYSKKSLLPMWHYRLVWSRTSCFKFLNPACRHCMDHVGQGICPLQVPRGQYKH